MNMTNFLPYNLLCIFQGFLDMKMKNWVRNIITRVIAIAPSLIVAVVSGPSGAGKLIILSSVLLLNLFSQFYLLN